VYGTVARMTVKPGLEQALDEQLKSFETVDVPGFIRTTIYRLDSGSNEYVMAVVFDSKESYVANAESPEQNARYEEMRALLETAPEWSDGEIIHETA